jgi:low affinity Fe/Cu permease
LHLVRLWLTRLGTMAAHPAAFALLGVFAAAWLILDPVSFGWPGTATVATLFMTLLIQRAEHRDTQALHAKLDELLRVSGDARTELTTLDQQEPESIERHRADARAQDPS